MLGLLALAVRALYLIESGDNPFRVHLDLDPRNYHEWALAILRGEPFGDGPFLQAPLYPYFLSLCYLVLGVDSIRPLWIQALLAAGTVGLASLIAHRYWGRAGLLATGLLLVFYKPAIFYTGVLLVPILATALVTLALWLAPRRHFWAGVCAGLAGLAHPTILPGAALVMFVMMIPPGARFPARSTLLRAAVGLALAILPATVYNAVRSGAWVPISANTGINLYIGNGPEANGFYRSPFGMRGEVDPCGIAEAGRLTGRPPDPVSANRFWIDATLAAAAEDPGRMATLLGLKLWSALGTFEVPQIESFDFEKRFSLLLRLPFLPGWIALLMLTAAGCALRPRDRLIWGLAGGVLLTALVMAAFFVTGRFRMPAHLFLGLAAGGTAATAWNRLARKTPAREQGAQGEHGARAAPGTSAWLRAAGAMTLVGLLFVPNWPGIQKDATFAQYHYRLGVIAEREGRDQAAYEAYQASLAIDPHVARANINLGVMTARRGDLDQARELLLRGTRLDPRSARALLALGQIEEIRGNLSGAAAYYSQAWSVDSTFVRALESLMAAHYVGGDLAAAQAQARELLNRVGSDAMGRRARFLLQRLDERGAQQLPLAPNPQRARADLLLAAGRIQEAAVAYQDAAHHNPDDPVPALELARLFRALGREEEAQSWRRRYLDGGGPAALLEGPGP